MPLTKTMSCNSQLNLRYLLKWRWLTFPGLLLSLTIPEVGMFFHYIQYLAKIQYMTFEVLEMTDDNFIFYNFYCLSI